jgi:hypothetical protein
MSSGKNIDSDTGMSVWVGNEYDGLNVKQLRGIRANRSVKGNAMLECMPIRKWNGRFVIVESCY